VLTGVWWVYQTWPVALPPPPADLTLIAHRGVHHDFPLDGVQWDTCTAARIFSPTHEFIENTLPSMRAAFEAGASIVEVDLRVTRDRQLAVFHDFMLECRTEASGDVDDRPLAELQTLDVGYGYTADDGATFPLRGTGVGMMPSLDDVLAEFPDQRIMLDPKDERAVILPVLADRLRQLPPERRARISLWAESEYEEQLDVPGIQRQLAERGSDLKRCGHGLPQAARHRRATRRMRHGRHRHPSRLPGTPAKLAERFLSQASAAGVPVYVETDDVRVALQVAQLPISGVLTDRIEEIGPAVTAVR
jgi:glycerophosphoryl diester phosphodiesterase